MRLLVTDHHLWLTHKQWPSWAWRPLWVGILALLCLLGFPAPASAAPASKVQAQGAPVKSQEEIQRAVVRIEVTGVFADPVDGETVGSYTGSGFLIDPSGIIVTNNHVVTGAALIKVYVDGQETPLNAKVLGVSECADLAVLDIAGEDYPYFTWYEQPLKVGTKIYTAGYPLGDPEFTLTSGIIAKAKAKGETAWSSIDYAVQHDATIQPGNSGGPLVTESGQVVGINYASDPEHDQYFAIPAALARPIVQTLSKGQNLDTLGINGRAFRAEEVSGIWVFSVKSGSPAGKAGIQAGDILLGIENLVLAEDGTMHTYCDILRSHEPTDVLSVQLVRFNAAGEAGYGTGEINGDEITITEEIANPEKPTPTPTPKAGGQGEEPIQFTTWTDNDDIVSVDTPDDWQDTVAADWLYDDQPIGVYLLASPDLSGFDGGWTTPGVLVGVSELLSKWSHEEVLSTFADQGNACLRSGPYDFSNDAFRGIFYFWQNCNDDPDVVLYTVALTPDADESLKVVMHVQLVTGDNEELVGKIINSVVVHRAPPEKRVWATVQVGRLNMRSGGGTNYPVIANLANGADLLVVGQINNCSWLHVIAPDGSEGWVSGAAKFVRLNQGCGAIAAE